MKRRSKAINFSFKDGQQVIPKFHMNMGEIKAADTANYFYFQSHAETVQYLEQ